MVKIASYHLLEEFWVFKWQNSSKAKWVGAQQFGALDWLPPPLKLKDLVIWTNPKAESFVWQTAASRIQHEDFLKTWEVHHMVFRAETSKMPKLLRKVAGECIFRLSGLCCYHKNLRRGTLQKEAYLIDDLGSQKSKISFWLRTFYYTITWQMTSWWKCMLRVKITWWDKKPDVGRREASSLLILVEWITAGGQKQSLPSMTLTNCFPPGPVSKISPLLSIITLGPAF